MFQWQRFRHIVDSDVSTLTVQREGTSEFPWQQWLRKRTTVIQGVYINYRRILQNHIFTNTEHKYTILLPFERGMFAVS